MPPTSSPDEARVFRSCPLCEAICGINVRVAGNRATEIRGDADDPLSHGYLCPKAHGLIGLQADPDRLRRPLRREGTRFVEIDWDEAFALAASKLRALRDAHGVGALAAYAGNPTVHDFGATLFVPALMRSLGGKKRFSATSVDQLPKMLSSAAMFGGGLTIPIPDVDRCSHLLVLGANPLASNGSLMTAPDMRGRLRRLRDRGGRLVVVDPRRSETAAVADEHHFIRPGSDALFLFSLVHTLFDEGLVALGRLEASVAGVDRVRELAQAFPAEDTAAATGIPAEQARRIAREFAAAESAACYGRMGTCTQRFGTLASWLVDVVNTLSGNLDHEGGVMFPRSATSPGRDRPGPGKPVAHARWRSSVRNLPESFGEFPVAALAEEIDSAGDDRIRGLVTVAGNPVLSTPNSDRLAKALEALDFMVSVDFYINETTRFADLILPPTSPLERANYDLAFSGLAVRNVAKYSPLALEPPSDGMPQWRILAEIAGGLNGVGAEAVDEMVLGSVLAGCVGSDDTACPDVTKERARELLGDTPGPERILDAMLRAGPYGDRFDPENDGLNLERLKQAEHGVDLGALTPRLPELLTTPSGAIELAPPHITDDVPRLREALRANGAGDSNGSLLLVGRRQMRSNNSWMHNIESLAKGRDRCTLLVHPEDARRFGLADGQLAWVRSRVGELTAPVVLSDEMMRGVVSLPHGFGHDTPGSRMRVAAAQAGVNSNRLSDERDLDALSGNAVLNGVRVEIGPAGAA